VDESLKQSAFNPAAVRKARVQELRSSVAAAQKALNESRASLGRDPFPSLLANAERGRWAELDRAVDRAKSQNSRKMAGCGEETVDLTDAEGELGEALALAEADAADFA
jgi:hypothetical protein